MKKGLVVTFIVILLGAFSLSRLTDIRAPEQTLKWVNSFFISNMIPVEKFEVIFKRGESFAKWSVFVNGGDFCLQMKDVESLCFEKIFISADLNLLDLSNFELTEVFIRDKKIIFNSSESIVKKKQINIQDRIKEALSYFSRASIFIDSKIDISLSKTRVNDKNLKFSLVKKNNHITLHLNLEDLGTVYLEGETDNFLLKVSVDDHVVESKVTSLGSIIRGQLNYKSSLIKGEVTYDIEKRDNEIYLILKDGRARSDQVVNRLEFPFCQMNLDLGKRENDLEFNCNKITLVTNYKKMDSKITSSYKMQDFSMDFLLKAQIKNNLVWDDGENDLINISLNGETLNTFFGNSVVHLESQIFSRNYETSAVVTKLDYNIKIKSLSSFLKKTLKSTRQLPAPFTDIDGGVEIKSSGFNMKNESMYELSFKTFLNLDDRRNKIKSYLDSTLRVDLLKKKYHLDSQVTLNKLVLYLPDIDPMKGIPGIFKDDRIIVDSKESKNEVNFSYDVTIKTIGNNSVEVHYYLFKPSLRFGFEVRLADSVMYELNSSKASMRLEYLERIIELEQLSLSNSKDKLPMTIKLLYKTSGYKIYFNIIGGFDSPRLLLESSPRLPREDILSLILFNKKSSEISSAQDESVGGADAAILNRSLGLFSLWAFASTPIESVSYDPSRQVYSAQVRMPGGILLDIGTNWEKVNNLSLKRRLNDTWMIMTSYILGESDQSSGNLLLQKEINY